MQTHQAEHTNTARVEAAGIPYNKTDDGYLLHDPSQNGVLLRSVG